jgi:glycosyltransferase involved in cell wall biosynthesis
MSSRKVKVLVLLPNLVSAGGQRAVLNFFYGLDRTRFDPELVIQERLGSFLPETEGRSGISFLLDRPFTRTDLPHLIRETTRHAKRADVVVAALEGRASFCGLVAAKLARKPVVAWIHIDWRPFLEMVSWRQKLALRSYALADRIAACSVGAAKSFAEIFRIPEHRIGTIYNGIPLDVVRKNADERLPDHLSALFDQPTVVMVGRLDEQKGYPYLIDAHARLINEGLQHNLVVVGEGGLKPMLEAQVASLGVAGSVHFVGFQSNPHRFIKRATVFALPSIFEGFGLVIAEALACGTPVVSTDCPSGPAEILADGKYGLLVPPRDPVALADGIRTLLSDAEQRSRLSVLGQARAGDFDEREKLKEWEALLTELATRGAPKGVLASQPG